MFKLPITVTVFLAVVASFVSAKQIVVEPVILGPVPRTCSAAYDTQILYLRPNLERDLKYVQLYGFPDVDTETTAIVHLASDRMVAVYGTEVEAVHWDFVGLLFTLEDSPKEYSLRQVVRQARQSGFDADLMTLPDEVAACFEGHS